MNEAFWIEIRRGLVSMGWALSKEANNPTLLAFTGAVKGDLVLTDFETKCYNLNGIEYELTIEVEEPADAPSENSKELSECNVHLKLRQAQVSQKK